jgi:uracil-DNA glycosylase
MKLPPELRRALRAQAQKLERLDGEVYADFDQDPLEPLIGLGGADRRIAFFGRDPGREEIRHGLPFIGSGGQKVRAALYRHLCGEEMPGFEASVQVGRHFFWANTVPYKPAGNKAWPMSVKKAFQPLMAELLLRQWRGRDVITLGREAFLWFGINQPRETRQALEGFWGGDERFAAIHETRLSLPTGEQRRMRLHPLPHPSPLNATWFKHFPGLLEERLRQLDARPDNLTLGIEKPSG